MSRINTNVQSLIAQRVLAGNNTSLGQALERLGTGYRINRGKDDPSGLIASENIRAEQKGLNAAIANADRADQVANIAEGGLQEISTMLTELQGLLTQSANRAGLSNEEKNANQLQIDSILQTIDRISSATSFQGTRLLNGSMDFTVSGLAAGVTDYRVNAAKLTGSKMDVDVQITQSAQQGGLFLSAGASALDLNTGSSFVIEITGVRGARELSFASGTSLSKIAETINTFSDVTGVTATVSGTGIRIVSNEYGASEFVSVKVLKDAGLNATANGDAGSPVRGLYSLASANFAAANTTGYTTFVNANNGVRDTGQNLGATINGQVAVTNGRTARISTDFLDAEVTFSVARATQLGNVGSGSSPAFAITGGGADFHLASKVDVLGRVSMGIGEVSTRKLGNSEVGFLASLGSGNTSNVVNGSLEDAQKIVARSIEQVTGLRGRLGAFQKNTVGTTIRSLGVAVENTAAALSVIRDADFASETAQLTRSQILVNASTNVLSLANQSPNAALQLLG